MWNEFKQTGMARQGRSINSFQCPFVQFSLHVHCYKKNTKCLDQDTVLYVTYYYALHFTTTSSTHSHTHNDSACAQLCWWHKVVNHCDGSTLAVVQWSSMCHKDNWKSRGSGSWSWLAAGVVQWLDQLHSAETAKGEGQLMDPAPQDTPTSHNSICLCVFLSLAPSRPWKTAGLIDRASAEAEQLHDWSAESS